jgi:integrase
MFRTVTGKEMVKGSLSYHWTPIRSGFRGKVSEERWEALTAGERDLDLYVLRHRVASVMADRGATAREIAEQLGNTPEVCERTYIHPFSDDVRERNRKLLDQPAVVELRAVGTERGA